MDRAPFLLGALKGPILLKNRDFHPENKSFMTNFELLLVKYFFTTLESRHKLKLHLKSQLKNLFHMKNRDLQEFAKFILTVIKFGPSIARVNCQSVYQFWNCKLKLAFKTF